MPSAVSSMRMGRPVAAQVEVTTPTWPSTLGKSSVSLAQPKTVRSSKVKVCGVGARMSPNPAVRSSPPQSVPGWRVKLLADLAFFPCAGWCVRARSGARR
nr:hypothetical protein [Actinomadura syzygii]